jgi:hypothetical protein
MSEPLIIAASMAAVFVGTIVLVWTIMWLLGRGKKYE